MSENTLAHDPILAQERKGCTWTPLVTGLGPLRLFSVAIRAPWFPEPALSIPTVLYGVAHGWSQIVLAVARCRWLAARQGPDHVRRVRMGVARSFFVAPGGPGGPREAPGNENVVGISAQFSIFYSKI